MRSSNCRRTPGLCAHPGARAQRIPLARNACSGKACGAFCGGSACCDDCPCVSLWDHRRESGALVCHDGDWASARASPQSEARLNLLIAPTDIGRARQRPAPTPSTLHWPPATTACSFATALRCGATPTPGTPTPGAPQRASAALRAHARSVGAACCMCTTCLLRATSGLDSLPAACAIGERLGQL